MKKIYLLFFLFAAVVFTSKAQTVMTIEQARVTMADGNPADSGMTIQTSGIVEGPNFYPTPNGDAFFLRGASMGIQVYAKHGYNYPVNEGDSVTVVGTLSGYHGNAEIDLVATDPLDTIIYLSQGTILPATVVPVLSAADDGLLREIDGIDMSTVPATGSGSWTITAGKHYFTIHASGFYIYIDSFRNAAMFNHAPINTGIYNIRGIVTQYAFNPPYTTGFDINPRSINDFIQVTGINSVSNDASEATIYPNPNTGSFIIKFSDNTITNAQVDIFDISGRMVYSARQSADGGAIRISADGLNAGIYIVEVRSGENIFRNKITVQK